MEDFLVVEKIYKNMAFCENYKRQIIKIPLEILPENIEENDCIVYSDGIYIIDRELTNKRKREALELTKSLFL